MSSAPSRPRPHQGLKHLERKPLSIKPIRTRRQPQSPPPLRKLPLKFQHLRQRVPPIVALVTHGRLLMWPTEPDGPTALAIAVSAVVVRSK